MTNPLTEMDERRAEAMFSQSNDGVWDNPQIDPVTKQIYRQDAVTIRQSDEANHIGYYDTRTHVVVAFEDMRAIFKCLPDQNWNTHEDNIRFCDIKEKYAAILTAQEDDNNE